jgi:Lon protease-like protein
MASEQPIIPDTAPVMVLGGATLFPHGYMPLFIFEPRYREMLDYCLARERIFCVGHARAGIDCEKSPDPVHRITTAGLVRACVTHDDGTSHLMLSGLHRVEIIGWAQHSPFRIASILPLDCLVRNRIQVAAAAQELVDLSGKLCGEGLPLSQQLREHLRCVRDPSAIADLVGHSFVNDPDERQRLLEMLCIDDRLDYLVAHLAQLLAGGGSPPAPPACS